MCGVICRLASNPHDSFYKGLGALKHRGPDNQGYKLIGLGDFGSLELGHVRLSILDTNTRSDQPFSLDGKNFLLFNGEIYNYKELSQEFLSEIDLVTTSDTEVLWYLLKIYGFDVLSKVIGMYAVVYYEDESKTLLVSRDSLGIKPLYLFKSEHEIVFSSEIRGIEALGIKPLKDLTKVPEYLQFGYLHEPETGYMNITKVVPGEIISISLSDRVFSTKQLTAFERSNKTFVDMVNYSVQLHERADVKQTLFYSGGIDSTILLDKLNADKVKPLIWKSNADEVGEAGFSNDYVYAKRILNHLGRDYIEVEDEGSSEEFIQSIKEMVDGIEELTCDYTYISSLRLSQLARELGFTVAHSGMGADEIFGGYPRYLAFKFIIRYRYLLKLFIPIFSLLKTKTSKRFVSAISANSDLETYTSLICYFSRKEIQELIGNFGFAQLQRRKEELWRLASSSTPLKTAMSLDFSGFLSHNFIVADKSSMQASIELRVPLANQLTMSWFSESSDSNLIYGITTKISLRKILYSSIDKKFFKRKKAGFNPPMDRKINEIGLFRLQELLLATDWHGSINGKAIDALLQNHFNGIENNTYKIVNLLFLKFWLERQTIE
jgi:asparagine synthase (glutamine-hydrolysing)